MGIRNPAELDGLDAETALDAAFSVTEDVRICVEFDTDRFNTLYVDEETLSLYGGEAAALDHFEVVHSYVHVDFTERDLFEDVLFAAGSVHAFVTYMDHATIVRVLAEDSGIFFALSPGAPVTETLDAVREALAE